MPPNTVELPLPDPELTHIQTEFERKGPSDPPRLVYQENYWIKVVQSSITHIAHLLVGAITTIAFLYSFSRDPGPTPTHIMCCVVGYQLLMAEAILALSSESGWALRLTLVHRRRAHLVMQIVGGVLIIFGTITKVLDKAVHFNSNHGIFGLIALIFTTVSLVNGLASLYAYELRSCLPGNLSKITHVCFGTIAYVASCVCLCLGFAKPTFTAWVTEGHSKVFISLVSILAFIVIINPAVTFFTKSKSVLRR